MESGLSPFDALRAGTSGAAEFMHAETDFGTVAAGRRADLILLDENPLEDVVNARNPVGVMVRGRWHTRDELASKLSELEARFKLQAR